MGARFIFTIPTVEEPGSGTANGPARLSTRSSRRMVGEHVRILAVDDDPQALRYVRDALASAGYTPVVTGDPAEALRLVAEEKPDLVLLDLMLPGTDGIELMKTVPELSDVPVIFLSAYGRDQIIARALEAGAVDYIVKPFSPTELVARINTALKRGAAPESVAPSEPYRPGDLTIDYAERTVSLAGRPVPLADIEYRLLFELSVHAGRVLGNEHLLQRVWGMGTPGTPGRLGPRSRTFGASCATTRPVPPIFSTSLASDTQCRRARSESGKSCERVDRGDHGHRPPVLRLLHSADGLPEMPEASALAWALTGAHEENPVRSRMEHTGETARQRARPPGP